MTPGTLKAGGGRRTGPRGSTGFESSGSDTVSPSAFCEPRGPGWQGRTRRRRGISRRPHPPSHILRREGTARMAIPTISGRRPHRCASSGRPMPLPHRRTKQGQHLQRFSTASRARRRQAKKTARSKRTRRFKRSRPRRMWQNRATKTEGVRGLEVSLQQADGKRFFPNSLTSQTFPK